uniref:Uncharacterized protein n=1 Tax=Glossina austeni TaxID=7395 RepID=A0A1A9V0X9_GLOAU
MPPHSESCSPRFIICAGFKDPRWQILDLSIIGTSPRSISIGSFVVPLIFQLNFMEHVPPYVCCSCLASAGLKNFNRTTTVSQKNSQLHASLHYRSKETSLKYIYNSAVELAITELPSKCRQSAQWN